MKKIFLRLTTILAIIMFGMVPVINAAGPGGGVGNGGSGGIGEKAYSTYTPCTLGCTSILTCDADGRKIRVKADSYSDPC